MKHVVLGIAFLMLICCLQPGYSLTQEKNLKGKYLKGIISETFRIDIPEFPEAFNPSICEADYGFILTFRYLPEPVERPWISFVGVMLLDHSFQAISKPQILNLREADNTVISQAEDARVFSCNGRYYVVYNDNHEIVCPHAEQRRDIYIAEFSYVDDQFIAERPVRLCYPKFYEARKWEKNWTPFVKDGRLLLSYSLDPHEVIVPDLETGICQPYSFTPERSNWRWGWMRGGTPSLLVDGEYLGFFHTGIMTPTGASYNEPMWHYFMGAYTFSPQPPFQVTKISPVPLMDSAFYLQSDHPKRVIYPGGFVMIKDDIYVAFGKNDTEVWIAKINKNVLKGSLRSIEKKVSR